MFLEILFMCVLPLVNFALESWVLWKNGYVSQSIYEHLFMLRSYQIIKTVLHYDKFNFL